MHSPVHAVTPASVHVDGADPSQHYHRSVDCLIVGWTILWGNCSGWALTLLAKVLLQWAQTRMFQNWKKTENNQSAIWDVLLVFVFELTVVFFVTQRELNGGSIRPWHGRTRISSTRWISRPFEDMKYCRNAGSPVTDIDFSHTGFSGFIGSIH